MTKKQKKQLLERLEKFRHNVKITYAQLATLMGTSESSIRRWRMDEYEVPDSVECFLDVAELVPIAKLKKELIK